MMVDEGFGGNNPKLRLAQLDAALLRLCRYLVGIRLHTAGMTYEQAVEFFMREGYQARTNAEREARRGTLDPTYLVYALGKMEILRLREEWRRQLGDSFRIGDFHDRLLSYGSPPIKILRMAMLGEGGARAAADGAPQAAEDVKPVPFSVLATGKMSAHGGGRSVELITDEAGWRRTWDVIGKDLGPGGLLMPEINFDTHSVVVVYLGERQTLDYDVEITGIKRIGTVLAVETKERQPPSGLITALIRSSPFVAVSIPRPPTGATVRFADAGAAAQGPQQERNTNVKPRPRGPVRRRRRH
jgi:hypothetical protein